MLEWAKQINRAVNDARELCVYIYVWWAAEGGEWAYVWWCVAAVATDTAATSTCLAGGRLMVPKTNGIFMHKQGARAALCAGRVKCMAGGVCLCFVCVRCWAQRAIVFGEPPTLRVIVCSRRKWVYWVVKNGLCSVCSNWDTNLVWQQYAHNGSSLHRNRISLRKELTIIWKVYYIYIHTLFELLIYIFADSYK